MRLIDLAKRLRGALDRWLNPGPWQHVEFPTPLIRVPNREADRIFADIISRRAA